MALLMCVVVAAMTDRILDTKPLPPVCQHPLLVMMMMMIMLSKGENKWTIIT